MVESESDSLKDLAMRKVGPLPLVAWAGAFVVVWYVVEKRNSSSAATAAAATGASTATGSTATDANVDPATGFDYGTTADEDQLAQDYGTSGGSSSTAAYTTNSAWQDAAINYLVGLGVDAVSANSAISAYLGSQTLTTTQQAQVNEAVTALGAPPQPPSPATTTSVVNPPGGGTMATNPPTGLTVTSTMSTAVGLKWNSTTNATGYTVTYTAPGKAAQTLSTSTPSATLSGLTPQTSYSISVQATPADAGAGSATTTVTTSYGAVTGSTPVTVGSVLTPGQVIQVDVELTSSKNATAVAKQFDEGLAELQGVNPGLTATTSSGVIKVPYQVKPGDTLASIASRFQINPENLSTQLQAQGIS